MTDRPIRFYPDCSSIRSIGERLVSGCLPARDWTHEAHLAACLWLIRERHDLVAERDLPRIIRAHNDHVGTINSDVSGYHETLTQFYIATVRAFDANLPQEACLSDRVNALLAAPQGARDWPLRFYSRGVLFSVAARRSFVAPDRISSV